METQSWLRRNRVLVVVLAVVVIAAVGWVRVSASRRAQANASRTPAATAVITARVVQEDVASYLTGIGTVQPMQSVTVRARVDGQLDRIAFREGQEVHRGDLLAQIDPRSYQALAEQAVAQKAHDTASLTSANKDLARYASLLKDNSIARQAYDAQTATVEQLKASLQSDQAAIDNANVQLGYTTIRSPIDGRTGLRLVDVGNLVHATDTNGIVVINQIDPIAVLFTLPEDNFQQVNQALQANRSGLQVVALGRDDGAQLGTGTLLLVNNQIDTGTGTFQLKASFTNPAHTLWPGQYVNARLVLGTKKGALTLPETAVQRGANGLYVYVVGDDGVAKARPVRVAQTQDGKVVIDSGVAAGERVVIDGQFKIRQGSKITEADPNGGASKPAAQAGKSP